MRFEFIMPMYNAERFVELSMKSVLRQTFADWRLTVIDDGSTDGSAEIVKRYSNTDDRIVYVHQNNGGVSNARNNGLKRAVGEYIIFLDSDDEIAPNTLEILDGYIQKYSADVVTYNMYRVDINTNICGKVTVPLSDQPIFIDNEEDFKTLLYPALVSDKIFVIIGNFTVRNEIVRDIRFRTDMVMYEDLVFDMEMYERCKNAVCIPDYLFFYRDNPSGAVRTFNYKKLDNLKVIYDKKIEFAALHDVKIDIKSLLQWFCLSIVYEYWALCGNKRLEREYISKIKSDKYFVQKFDQAKKLGVKCPELKIVMGTSFERFVLRSIFLTKKRIKKLLHR